VKEVWARRYVGREREHEGRSKKWGEIKKKEKRKKENRKIGDKYRVPRKVDRYAIKSRKW
jgi:hypothetical protein